MNLDKLKVDIKEGNLHLTNSDICSIFKPMIKEDGILNRFLCLICSSGCAGNCSNSSCANSSCSNSSCSNTSCSNSSCSNSSCSNSSCYISCASGCTGAMTKK